MRDGYHGRPCDPRGQIWMKASRRHSATLVVVMACMFGLASCEEKSAAAPPRPESVPEKAVWAGGVDGGSWFLCEPLDVTFHYWCKVYDDHSGALLADAEFTLKHVRWDRENDRPVTSDIGTLDFRPRVFDGSEIDLDGSLFLEPVSPVMD